MKKFFSLISICLCLFLNACCLPTNSSHIISIDPDATIATPPVVTEPTEPMPSVTAYDAIEYLKAYYQNDGSHTATDSSLLGYVRIGGVTFDVEWAVDVGENLVKLIGNDDGTITLDINEGCPQDIQYTLNATVTDIQGNIVSHSWIHILPQAQDMAQIVKVAYDMDAGESMPFEARLSGEITAIDTEWDEEYQNISVTIAVSGAEDMPIKCYRMQSSEQTADQIQNLQIGNLITVCGILINFDGSIEFDTGCILENVEQGSAIGTPIDSDIQAENTSSQYENEPSSYHATLTGTVISIDTPYNSATGRISVTMLVSLTDGSEYIIICPSMQGDKVDQIAIGDSITVSGGIKPYNGTYKFDAGCTMYHLNGY